MSKKNIGQAIEITESSAQELLGAAAGIIRALRARVLELEERVAVMRCCGNCSNRFIRDHNCYGCGESYNHWQPRTESDKRKV